MKSEVGNYLRINIEYSDEFTAWLNDNLYNQSHVATWHNQGSRAGEYSDIFLHYSGKDCSDELPEEVQAVIMAAVEEHHLTDCVVWLSNVKERVVQGWAFDNTDGDVFDGYDTYDEAFEGMMSLIAKGYSPKSFTGIYPIYEEV